MPVRRSFAMLCAALALPLAPVAAQTSGEWGKAGLQMQYVDTATRPGDDFDRYVNGKWTDTFDLPPDKSQIWTLSTLGDLSSDRLRSILDEMARSKHPAASPETRVAAAYAAFMNTDAIEAAGLTPHAYPPSDKPHGRKAWTLLFPGFSDPRWVDISWMPSTPAPEEGIKP